MVTDPLGHQSSASYTSDHLVATSTGTPYVRDNGDGTTTTVTHVTSTSYDAAGESVAVTDALGQVSHTAYTADGLTTSSTNTGGGVTSYGYDSTGNTLTVLSPSGNAKDDTNKSGTPARNTYTADNLLAMSLTAPTSDDGGSTPVLHQVLYTYDGGANKTSAGQNTTDTGGTQLTSSGLGGTQNFAYYPDGRQKTSTGRGDGKTVNGKLISEVQTSTYDAAGDTLTAGDTTSGITTRTGYYLDGLTRTVNDGQSGASGQPGQDGITATGYDGAGQALTTTQTTPSQTQTQTSTYAYNDADRPVRQTSDTVAASTGTPGTPAVPWTWTYDAGGKTLTATTPEGQTTSSKYNPDDTLSMQQAVRAGNTVSTWTYAYDNLSRQLTADGAQLQPGDSPTALNTPPAPAKTAAWRQTFGYDAAGRLTSNQDMSGPHTATYDADGNRLAYTTMDGLTTTTDATAYNADDSVHTTNTGGNYSASTYGPSGVLKSDRCKTYSFDGFDRMSSGTNINNSYCNTYQPAYANTSYAYDAHDRQRTDTQTTTSTNTDASGTVTHTTAPAAATMMTYDGNSTSTAAETDMTTDKTVPASSRRYTHDATGTQTAMTWTDNGSDYTQHLGRDGNGNVTQITGPQSTDTTTSTNVACATRSNPWGMPQTKTPTGGGTITGTGVGSSPSPCQTSSTNGTPTTKSDLFYNGERRDTGTGDYQLGARTYDPSKTAFISPDTYRNSAPTANLALGTDPLTNNRYNYVNGDPVNSEDPSGHAAAPTGDAAVRALADPRTHLSKYRQVPAYTKLLRVARRPGLGTVRGCLFISSAHAGSPIPGFGGQGDNRGVDPAFDPDACRVSFAVNFDTGLTALRQSPSCERDGACTTPAIGRGVGPGFDIKGRSEVLHGKTVSTLSVHLQNGDARGVGPYGILGGAPTINGQIDLIDVQDGRIHVGGNTSRYPALEVYEDNQGTTTSHIQNTEGKVSDLVLHGADVTLRDQVDQHLLRNDSRYFRYLSGPYYVYGPYNDFYSPTRAAYNADADESATGAPTAAV